MVSNSAKVGTRNLYALLVGIDNYPQPIKSLKGCVNDITAIQAYLKNQIAGEWQLREPRILTNEQATRAAIIDGFQNYLCQAGSEDIALFYYSGHGGQEKAPEEFWHLEPDRLDETLVCYDSRTPGNYDLADKELRYLLFQVAKKNPRVIVILDSCHSGSGTRDIPQGVRLAPEDTRDRPLSSFIFAEDASFTNLLLTASAVNKKKTGLELPKGRHILLAACRDDQYAKEYQGDDNQTRGAFSYFFLKSLEQTNGSLSYLDLARNIEALVKGKFSDQVPQLEATNPEDLKASFLGGAIPERPFYFTLRYNTRPNEQGWEIDAGVIHGIPKPVSADETTLLTIFPVGITSEQLSQVLNAPEARVTQVLTQKSKVEIIQGQERLDENKSYWAVVTSLPLKPLKVYIQGNLTEEIGIVLAKKALEKANSGQNSLYLKQVENPADADFKLVALNGQYWINQDERPVVAPIPKQRGYSENAAKEAIEALEAIARWHNILNLKSPQSSEIKASDVEMQIHLIGYEGKDGEIKPVQDSDKSLITDSELRLEYKYEDGEWRKPFIQVKLLNHSNQKLYANVIDLAEDYSVAVPFFDERSSVVLPAQTAESAGIVEGFDDISFSIPDEFLEQGITEYKDILKLIVSKTDFNASLLEQEGLKPPIRGTRGTESESSLDRLMNRVYSRNAARAGKKIDDWITKEVAITIVKPRDAEQLQPGKSAKLLNGLIEVQPHPSLQAQVTLTTVSQTTRDIGNLIAPPILWDEQGVIESFQFTNSRGSSPGLSGVELFAVNDVNSVTKEAPLTLLLNQTLEEGEYLLPVSYDGEFFLPLGGGVNKGKQIEIKLERLPQPTTSSRSLMGSIKIFFKKLRSQKLGNSYEYPILAAAEVKQTENQTEVIYEKDPQAVKNLVANAQKIVLYIHGIIGDTASMVGSIQQAKVELNGQLHPLREAYDLVLTFDYENLDTTIEENARSLKQRLESVGLGANHGKQLHIVAHSMGGLVSRWLIEREGGNQIVQHLVMLGTPNAGSPWPAVQDMTFTLLVWGLNQLPEIVWPAKVVVDLAAKSLEFLEAHDNALDQMQPDSEFFRAIANNPDPQVPYTIIAGDRSLPTLQSPDRLRRLMAKLLNPGVNQVVDDLVFGGEPNDIAVRLTSIKSVSGDRTPQPKVLPNVACDHLTYFTTAAGLKALADALHP
ncbi:peptidase C14 caspase catalytic subunit p20 [Tolypothrix tenuis PCC 7101]|uniref:Peptidase C14 caspase catalytic subunit p20 n=1 Tax=Tolypothrix tenuis PCC 7101 TaxID=231146 RepID=A0A1Z4MRX5_9CYAN|nr:caspase family protein [Aulosira sp. FACHB-113]BAY96218.1 peptidase C14 caspase catalytic subunit p20 [Tolypothrix tenuis PCC 7101]BAZ73275.1 peptidase C14 caspase catalytic subunit p20 [Aulosira laxa NIES-50]